MKPEFEQLRRDYIEALRPVVADALQWWAKHCSYPHTDPRPVEAMEPFHRRWIAGPAAHPRVLAVFRDYWFRVQELNDRCIAAPASDVPDAQAWGVEVRSPEIARQRAIDLLVNDLSIVAPDLFEVVQGVVYVPVGADPANGEEC